jgi:uncharacterized protein YuzE
MRVKVDLESDALYFRMSEDAVEESEEVAPGIVVDYAEGGKVVGIEVLGIKKRFSQEELSTMHVDLPTTAGKLRKAG